MKIVTYNIRFGMGLDGRIDLERIADTVRDADIVALQEVERYWQRSGMCDQPEILANHLKNFHWVYFPALDVDASEKAPDGSVHNRRRHFGVMTLSRSRILSARHLVLPKLVDDKGSNLDTGALECVIDARGGPLRVYNLHLDVSSQGQLVQIPRLFEFYQDAECGGGAWSGHARCQEVGENWHNDEAEPPMPAESLVLGDFNCEPGSDEHRLMVRSGAFLDSWEVTNGRGATRTTWVPPSPDYCPGRGMAIDHCFVTPELANRIVKVWVDDTAQGSDHRPYWVELGSPRSSPS